MTKFRYLSHLVREIKLFEKEFFSLIKDDGGRSALPPGDGRDKSQLWGLIVQFLPA